MGKLTMIGHVKDTSRVLKRAYNERFDYGQDFIDLFAEKQFKKVYFLGAGTSYHVSSAIKNVFETVLGIEGHSPITNIFANHEKINPTGIYKKDDICVIGFSQHGTSISTCQALEKANNEGYYTVAVTESLGSPITEIGNQTVHLVCEEEEIGPETRGYTETILQFYILAIEIAKKMGILNEEEYLRLDKDATKLIENFDTVVQESIDWYNRNKEEFLQMEKCSIAGYGPNYITALEARLKLFETYSRPCTAYEQEEQMHGPLRAYGPHNYIFLIGGSGPEKDRLKDLLVYYKRVFTEHVFLVTFEDDFNITKKDLKFSVKTTNLLSPILYVVPFQVLSALICEDVGIDTTISPIKDRSISSHMKRD